MHLIIAGTEFVLYVGLLHRDYHLPLHLQLSSEDLGQGPPAVFSYITKLLMVMVVMAVVVMMVVMMMVVTMMVVVMMVMVKMKVIMVTVMKKMILAFPHLVLGACRLPVADIFQTRKRREVEKEQGTKFQAKATINKTPCQQCKRLA